LCGFPDATNTGPRAGQQITTTVNGDLTITTAGAIIANTRVNGCVYVYAVNVTIRDSVISSHCAYGIRNFNGSTDYSGLIVQDTEINGNMDPASSNAFAYSRAVFLRDNIHGWENGFSAGDYLTVRDSYVHDLKCPTSTCGSYHPDDVQTADDSSNDAFIHNTMLAPITNSAFAVCCTSGGTVHDFVIDSSLLAGGGYTVYCPRYTSVDVRLTNNRFGPANFGPLASCVADHVTYANNVFDATGKPVPQA
jgi:hypothetical protein